MNPVPSRADRQVLLSFRWIRLDFWAITLVLLTMPPLFVFRRTSESLTASQSTIVLGIGLVGTAVGVFCIPFAMRTTDFAIAPGAIQLPGSKAPLRRFGWWGLDDVRWVEAVEGRAMAEGASARLRELLPNWKGLDRMIRQMLYLAQPQGLLVVLPGHARWYEPDLSAMKPLMPEFRKIEAHWKSGMKASET